MAGQSVSPPRAEEMCAHLHYVASGDPGARPVVLLIGLGMQLGEWPTAFVDRLASARLVIRIDNRDAGKSPRFGPDQEPGVAMIWQAQDGQRAADLVRYTLFDMRDDVLNLLDRIGVGEFDLVGFSLGGMISQLVAEKAGTRVGTYIQLASGNGTRDLNSQADALRRIARLFVAPKDDAQLRQILTEDANYYAAGSLANSQELQDEIDQVCDWGYYFGGAARHALACLGTPDRQHLLQAITARAFILHGDRDPAISVECGRQAATLIPGAEFIEFAGVGHVLDTKMLGHAADLLLNDGGKGTDDGMA